MSSMKPTLLLLHGAFTTPAAWDFLNPYLEKAGYPTERATYLSTNPPDPLEATVSRDTQHVRSKFLCPLVEHEGKDVVLVVHSYGGVVGAGAAYGFSKTDRVAQKLAGGVIGLIYVAGNIVPEGQSEFDTVGRAWPSWLMIDKPREGLSHIDPLVSTLCQDCPKGMDCEVERAATPQAYLCFTTAVGPPAWAEKGYKDRLAYIHTRDDLVNPPFAQDMWVEGSGVHWQTADMNTSHAPYYSQPEQLAEWIFKFSEDFREL
ncbi:hypothetical protein DOTSEDRAFT_157259 [Dothistroma septosporum NZE10]|uniref:AB hydrolase-1 domain-containing protein n=1 Tax=Dothistroma septosporum (strain NZE10 / CBS 128990) TaxID=675120 RepID=N1PGQ4_DOTSN|nr:hypothetical protein DOTSEDRAFT_157259 [Dothistroma septosporum NZE10]